MAGWKLTIRSGSRVKRERLDSLDEAVDTLERVAEQVRAERPLEEVKMIRTYDASDRVRARFEISGPGLLRRSEAGVDVMGDGRLVPYRGAILKHRLEPAGGESPYDAVRAALRGGG